VLAFAVLLLLFFTPAWALRQLPTAITTPVLIAASALAISAAGWIGLRSFAELER